MTDTQLLWMTLVATQSGILAALLPDLEVFSAHESCCTVPALAMQYGHTVHDTTSCFWLTLSLFMHLFFTRGMSKLYILLILALYQNTCGWGILKWCTFCYFVSYCVKMHSNTVDVSCAVCCTESCFSSGFWWFHSRDIDQTMNGCVQNALSTNSFS